MNDKAQPPGGGEEATPEPAREESAGNRPSGDESGDRPREIGGRKGPDPVRYGDWEKNGRCIDF
ncbi:MAG: DUF1674 domain-containing protein [Woeseiaceae bacterium]|jgi:hypothetical protein|nr:DUF1674 domain-containing protein [Woeseiaceae bacterium]